MIQGKLTIMKRTGGSITLDVDYQTARNIIDTYMQTGDVTYFDFDIKEEEEEHSQPQQQQRPRKPNKKQRHRNPRSNELTSSTRGAKLVLASLPENEFQIRNVRVHVVQQLASNGYTPKSSDVYTGSLAKGGYLKRVSSGTYLLTEKGTEARWRALRELEDNPTCFRNSRTE